MTNDVIGLVIVVFYQNLNFAQSEEKKDSGALCEAGCTEGVWVVLLATLVASGTVVGEGGVKSVVLAVFIFPRRGGGGVTEKLVVVAIIVGGN